MSITAADSIAGIAMPDTELVRETTACIWVTEDDVPFAHLPRVLLFGALPGRRRGLPPDRELLYSEAMYLGPLLVRERFCRCHSKQTWPACNAFRRNQFELAETAASGP
jgi:hypothetical protein